MSARPEDATATRTVALVTHMHPDQTSEAVRTLIEAAAGEAELVATAEEIDKHGEAAGGLGEVERLPDHPDLCLALGGDGTILHALRRYADTGVPVFGINFGTIGFLAAVERDDLAEGVGKALAGEFDTVALPGLVVRLEGVDRPLALNDVSFTRKPHGRVAELSYSLSGEEIGHVRCDGLVAATPAGSTGYNLANQGPVLAWGVEGYVVSFIAPHTLADLPTGCSFHPRCPLHEADTCDVLRPELEAVSSGPAGREVSCHVVGRASPLHVPSPRTGGDGE